jgi:hypothetical protein
LSGELCGATSFAFVGMLKKKTRCPFAFVGVAIVEHCTKLCPCWYAAEKITPPLLCVITRRDFEIKA